MLLLLMCRRCRTTNATTMSNTAISTTHAPTTPPIMAPMLLTKTDTIIVIVVPVLSPVEALVVCEMVDFVSVLAVTNERGDVTVIVNVESTEVVVDAATVMIGTLRVLAVVGDVVVVVTVGRAIVVVRHALYTHWHLLLQIADDVFKQFPSPASCT